MHYFERWDAHHKARDKVGGGLMGTGAVQGVERMG